MHKRILLLGLLIVSILACNKSEIETLPDSNFGFRYFPVEEGKTNEYVYDSITYDLDGTIVDTLTGFIKEVIAEPIELGTGEMGFKIMKYWKQNESDNYILTDVETIKKSETQVIVTEENLSFIKLVFPNLLNTKWDGNALFDDSIEEVFLGDPIRKYVGWRYTITERETSLDGINETFENVIRVDHIDSDEAVDRRLSYEYYAEGIGMVAKHMIILDTDKNQSTAPWEEKAELGFFLNQRLISHQ